MSKWFPKIRSPNATTAAPLRPKIHAPRNNHINAENQLDLSFKMAQVLRRSDQNSSCYAIHREITHLPEFFNSFPTFPSRCRCHRCGWWLSIMSIEQCCMCQLISSHWEALRHTCCLASVSNWRDPHDQDTSPSSSRSNRQVAVPTHWMRIWWHNFDSQLWSLPLWLIPRGRSISILHQYQAVQQQYSRMRFAGEMSRPCAVVSMSLLNQAEMLQEIL